MKLKTLIILFCFCVCLFWAATGFSGQSQDYLFLKDYIESLGMVSELGKCLEGISPTEPPVIDNAETAYKFLSCYREGKDNFLKARELVSKYSNSQDETIKEMSDTIAERCRLQIKTIEKIINWYMLTYNVYSTGDFKFFDSSAFAAEMSYLEKDRVFGNIQIYSCYYTLRFRNPQDPSGALVTLTQDEKEALLKRLDELFGPEVKDDSPDSKTPFISSAKFLRKAILDATP